MPIFVHALILIVAGTALATATGMGTLLLVIRIQTASANRAQRKAAQPAASV